MLTIPVAAASMQAFFSDAGHKKAELASIKNGEFAEVQTRGAGQGEGDEAKLFTSILASFERRMSEIQEI